MACERPLIFKIAVLSDFKKIILRIILEIRFLEGVILMSPYQEMWIQKNIDFDLLSTRRPNLRSFQHHLIDIDRIRHFG